MVTSFDTERAVSRFGCVVPCCAGERGMLCAWSLVTGKPILVWAAHHDAITALDWVVRIFSSDF